MGLYPDGKLTDESLAVKESSPSSPKGITLKVALTTSSLWLMAISFLTHGFSEVGILQTQVPYLRDIGFPLATASTAFGVVGLFSLIGKFGFGWMCDRILAKHACAIGLGVELVALIVLLGVNPESSEALLWLYVVVMGLGVGSWLPAMSMLVSTNFGLAAYGAIFGMVSFTMSIGASTGPLVSGYIFDFTGSYRSVFTIFIFLYLVAIATVLAVRRPDRILSSGPADAP